MADQQVVQQQQQPLQCVNLTAIKLYEKRTQTLFKSRQIACVIFGLNTACSSAAAAAAACCRNVTRRAQFTPIF
jgi:hypothetical protein